MLDRLLITAAIVLAAAVAYWIFTRFQRRRASGVETGSTGIKGPRVLYFRSDHCTSCTTQAELLSQLDEEIRRRMETVNVDEDPDRAEQYGVLTLPTTMIVDEGGEVRQINYGVIKPQKLQKQLAEAGGSA